MLIRLALGAAELLVDEVRRGAGPGSCPAGSRPVDEAVVVEARDAHPRRRRRDHAGSPRGTETDSAVGIVSADAHGTGDAAGTVGVDAACAPPARRTAGRRRRSCPRAASSTVWSTPTSSIAELISATARSAAFSPGGPKSARSPLSGTESPIVRSSDVSPPPPSARLVVVVVAARGEAERQAGHHEGQQDQLDPLHENSSLGYPSGPSAALGIDSYQDRRPEGKLSRAPLGAALLPMRDLVDEQDLVAGELVDVVGARPSDRRPSRCRAPPRRPRSRSPCRPRAPAPPSAAASR